MLCSIGWSPIVVAITFCAKASALFHAATWQRTSQSLSDNVPDAIKNVTLNTFSNFRKKLAIKIKISSFFRKWLNTNKRLLFNA
jgi:Txe/YoeB family toxin of Txe-Axe toxin-antitoxin module